MKLIKSRGKIKSDCLNSITIKTMKKAFLTLSTGLIILSLLSCNKERFIKGSGNITSENRVVDTFTGVESSGSAEVNIIYGAIQKVEVLVDDNVMSHLVTRVNNSTLYIEKENGINYRNYSLTVNITIPNLTSIKNSGSGKFDASGLLGLTSLSVKNSGSGKITLDGSGDDLTIKNSGSGKVYGFNFSSKDCYIKNSGSGKLEVSCTDNLDAKNSGSGNIYYKGNPLINFDNSGSGSIIDAN